MKDIAKIFFLILLLISCESEKTEIGVLKINPLEALPVELKDISADFGVVQLGGNDSILVDEISDLVLYQEKIYILDTKSKSVFVYDRNGNLLSHIHDYGQGANEYLSLSAFYIEDGDVVLVDNTTKKSFRYDDTGKLLSITPNSYSIKSVDYLSDGTKIVVRDMVDSSFPKGFSINVYTSADTAPKEFLPFGYKSGAVVFEKNHCVSAFHNDFYYNSLSSDTVWHYTDGKFMAEYKINFQGHGLPKDIQNGNRNEFGEKFYKVLLNPSRKFAYWPHILKKDNEVILLSYVYGNVISYCWYNLIDHTTSQICGPLLNDVYISDLSAGQFNSGDELCFVLDNYKISLLDKEKLNSLAAVYPSVYSALKGNRIDNNPILLIVKLDTK